MCQIYDVSPNYLVMEYIERESPEQAAWHKSSISDTRADAKRMARFVTSD